MRAFSGIDESLSLDVSLFARERSRVSIDLCDLLTVAFDPIDYAMVKSINEIGHVMGKQTVAEFVDSEAVMERLSEIGVDYAQGFAIGEPRPLGALVDDMASKL